MATNKQTRPSKKANDSKNDSPVRAKNNARKFDEKRDSNKTDGLITPVDLSKDTAQSPAANTPEVQTPRVERRRRRKTTAEIHVPERQTNINALRFIVKTIDVVLVCVIIAFGIWNSYIGINNNDIIAPAAAAILGAAIFITSLFASQAYRFAPAETLTQHLKTVLIAGLAALGVWLTFALIARPETFLPDTLAKAGFIATLILTAVHAAYHHFIKKLHMRGALAPTIVMLGATESARRLIEENAKTKELNILAIFDDRLSRAPMNIHGVPIVGKLDDLMAWDALPYINRIVVTLPAVANARKKDFVNRVRLAPALLCSNSRATDLITASSTSINSALCVMTKPI